MLQNIETVVDLGLELLTIKLFSWIVLQLIHQTDVHQTTHNKSGNVNL
jgi:hypothetical protein